jgi:hypothetical protein
MYAPIIFHAITNKYAGQTPQKTGFLGSSPLHNIIISHPAILIDAIQTQHETNNHVDKRNNVDESHVVPICCVAITNPANETHTGNNTMNVKIVPMAAMDHGVKSLPMMLNKLIVIFNDIIYYYIFQFFVMNENKEKCMMQLWSI